MAEKRNPAAGDGGARESRAGRLDNPENSRNRSDLQASARVDELLVRLSDRLRLGRLDGWALDFSKSIIAQARRGGRRWMPSPRQLEVMERTVAQAPDAGDADDVELIEPMEAPDEPA